MTNIIKLSTEKSEEQKTKKQDKPEEKDESKDKEEMHQKTKKLYAEYLHCNSDPKKHFSECDAMLTKIKKLNK